MAPPSGCISWARILGRGDSKNAPKPPTSTISDEPGVETSMPDDTRRLYNQAERPTSVVDAQKHIAQIRAEKGVGDPNGPSQDLVQALNLIATELYSEPSHFLQELIQNKDDCSYSASVAPELTFTFSPGKLRIDNNELGFTRANIHSLCGIGRTSKKGGDSIGQKGIGFKSIFKIADVVHVHSGFYSFKFDKATPLGMLVPEWSDFPEPSLPGATSMLLELSKGYESTEITNALKRIDSSDILFLRQLRDIHIRIYDSRSWLRYALWSRPDWETRITRQRETTAGAFRSISTVNKAKASTCWVTRYRLDNLPPEPRRAGRKRSELSLGFPVDQSAAQETELDQQLVYAFLPVRKYGFRFMIQADFLLVANREDLEVCPWNSAILEEIPNAFVMAIHELNKTEYRYSWLRYLPGKQDCQAPFADLPTRILDMLSTENVLESRDGTLTQPVGLTTIPNKFRDDRGRPLLPFGHAASATLSYEYPSCFNERLKWLGVKELQPADFLTQLQDFASEGASDFRDMSQEWHSTLARTLLTLHLEGGDLDLAIKKLPIIPLNDGRWVPASSGMIYFPVDPTLRKPMGLGILEVDSLAASIHDRSRLFKWLGVRTADKRELAQRIVDQHSDLAFQPQNNMSGINLVSHAVFLYKANWRDRVPHFWFASENGTCCLGRDAYLDVKRADESWVFSATAILSSHRSNFRFLHESYLETFGDEESRKWLCDTFLVETTPRLMQNVLPGSTSPPQSAVPLHDDFYFLVKNKPSASILCFLRDAWPSYCLKLPLLRERIGKPASSDNGGAALQIISALSNMEVDCHGGQKVKLKDTSLPREEVLARCRFSADMLCSQAATTSATDAGMEDSDELGCAVCHRLRNDFYQSFAEDGQHLRMDGSFLLHVPSPNDKRWHFLERLGVAISAGSEALLSRLKRLKGLGLDSQTTESHARAIYEQLENWAKRGDTSVKDVESIRQSFNEHALIFVPSNPGAAGKGVWVTTKLCVWDGPPCLENVKRITCHYPLCDHLFPKTLGIGFATLETLATEVQKLSPRDNVERICSLLEAVSQQLSRQLLDTLGKRQQTNEIPPFDKYAMFPVREAGSSDGTFILRAAAGSESWFIADKEPLRVSFNGRLDLMAMGGHDYDGIGPLAAYLRLERRLLSSHVSEETSLNDSGILARQFTNVLRMKARYLSLLVPRDARHRQETIHKLLSLEVYEASGVVIHRTVKFKGLLVKGVNEKADAGVVDEGTALRLYIPPSDLVEGKCPVEVVERLIEFCGIKRNYQFAASSVINERDTKRIEELLSRRGVPLSFDNIPTVTEQATVIRRSEHYLPFKSGFEGMDNGSFHISSPRVVDDHRDPQFYAELVVSDILRNIMGPDYQPSKHWTSSLRTRANYGPLAQESHRRDRWQFTIHDEKGMLTEAFAPGQVPKSSSPGEPPTYFIQVCATTAGPGGHFCFTYDIVDDVLAKPHSDLQDAGSPRHTRILARVCDIYGSPEVQFFTNPWKLFLDGFATMSNSWVSGTIEARETAALAWRPTIARPISAPDQPNYYEYEFLALEHIRLLELLPGSDADDLKGVIHHHGINSPTRPPYRALSYVWGSPMAQLTNAFTLSIGDGVIKITPSLNSALRHLRALGRSEWLWVDAICINQQNKAEKALQIRLMQDIYRLANEVVVWLGTAEEGSDLAIDILDRIHSALTTTPCDVPDSVEDARRDGLIRQYLEDGRGSVAKLLSRSWFTRVWVVQELVWGPRATVRCGASNISWDKFYTALRMCEEHSALSFPSINTTQQLAMMAPEKSGMERSAMFFPNAGPLHALAYMRNRLTNQHRKLRLLDLLDMFSYAKATEPLDKIFALLSLAGDGHALFFADYDSKFEEVICRFAQGFVGQGEALDLLYRSGLGKAYNFCSWIPNWTTNGRASVSMLHKTISTWRASEGPGKEFSFFQVAPDVPMSREWEPKLGSGPRPPLKMPGRSVDRIEAVADTALPTDVPDHSTCLPIKLVRDMRAVISSLCGINNNSTRGKYHYPTGEALEDVTVRLLIGAASGPHGNANATAVRENRLHALSTTATSPLQDGRAGEHCGEGWEADLKTVISSVYLDADMSAYTSLPLAMRVTYTKYWETAIEFARRFPSPRFAITERGYLCVVPGGTQKGDVVCIFPRARVPFLLRSKREEDSFSGAGTRSLRRIWMNDSSKMIGKKDSFKLTEKNTSWTSGEGPYELVGECYVHGIMFGEDKSFENAAARTPEVFSLE